jgi:hypothetical protein
LLTDLDNTAGDNIFHQGRVDTGARNERAQDLCVQVDRMHAMQCAAGAALTEGRAHHIHNHGPSRSHRIIA